jgi:hypothetical protein
MKGLFLLFAICLNTPLGAYEPQRPYEGQVLDDVCFVKQIRPFTRSETRHYILISRTSDGNQNVSDKCIGTYHFEGGDAFRELGEYAISHRNSHCKTYKTQYSDYEDFMKSLDGKRYCTSSNDSERLYYYGQLD